jgi:ABC-type proline/glycine betaine transport system substrate-binding protein
MLLLQLWREIRERLGDAAPRLIMVGRSGWENEAMLRFLERHPELVPVLENLAGRLSAVTMQQLNAAVDLDHQSPELVVRRWRQEQ